MNRKDTILIVDDNLQNLNMLFKSLRQAGYEVMVAQDGPSALKRVEILQPDLILMDVMMVGMDGFETAARLKAQSSSEHIPIIFLTALDKTSHIVKGFKVGGVDYLIKPLQMEEALARIHTHLSLRKSQRLVETQARELTALLELSKNMVSMLDLKHLANLILDQLKTVVDYTACALMTITTDKKSTILAHRGVVVSGKTMGHCLFSEILQARPDLFDSLQPLVVGDVRHDERLQPFLQAEIKNAQGLFPGHTRAWMGVPLALNQQIIGGISLCHAQPNLYTPQQADLVSVFAGQAAVAIENARLYQQAQQVGVHEERNRLARTLHDSVTQSLFSASLIAEVLPQVWQRDPAEGQQGLDELRLLTRGALAEMRTLLLELRPAALLKTRLDELLRQLALSVTSQTEATVNLKTVRAPDLPETVHVTFYRIAQEALNNIIKHAQASTITVTLQTDSPNHLNLVVEDDGRGFEAAHMPPGKLGLEIMSERAAQIEANLTITSQPGQGTRISLTWVNQ